MSGLPWQGMVTLAETLPAGCIWRLAGCMLQLAGRTWWPAGCISKAHAAATAGE